MQPSRKRILLKLSGELLTSHDSKMLDTQLLMKIIEQLKQLKERFQWALVMGGGNIFRGSRESKALGIQQTTGDAVGILATMINGLIVQDFLVKAGLKTSLFGALNGFGWSKSITPQELEESLERDDCLVFTGGVGTPFFTTDTTAVIRALQIKAEGLWKLTKVNGIYSADPLKNPDARLLKQVSYVQALHEELYVLDPLALTLAKEHSMPIRVFSMYEPDTLMQAINNDTFGSTLSNEE